MRVVVLERIDQRHRIQIKCRERCRDAIWWSNVSQAVKRNVFSVRDSVSPVSPSSHSTRQLPCSNMPSISDERLGLRSRKRSVAERR
ncbi:hypothetical protein NQZ68_037788 [Dissostichus eleginoides]|nr:hypothetical protein NQZ68_037788 [Dissostichus eleginoides]